MTRTVTLGTRSSDLAMAQSRCVADRLMAAHPGLVVRFREFKTTGDTRLDLDLRKMAGEEGGALGKGLFTRELEVALLEGDIDLAVHSLKDLPTRLPAGLTIGAVLEREVTSDVLVSLVAGGVEALPMGATVATGSERRRLQLLAARPDLRLVGLRGNVPTRLRKLVNRQAGDAIILAAAGLRRLGLPSTGMLPFDGQSLHLAVLDSIMLPAVGQGIIGIECRARDPLILPLLRAVHHAPTGCLARAERALLRALGGGCQMPLGVASKIEPTSPPTLHMQAVLFRGSHSPTPFRTSLSGPANAPARLAQSVARRLLNS